MEESTPLLGGPGPAEHNEDQRMDAEMRLANSSLAGPGEAAARTATEQPADYAIVDEMDLVEPATSVSGPPADTIEGWDWEEDDIWSPQTPKLSPQGWTAAAANEFQRDESPSDTESSWSVISPPGTPT